MAFTTILTERRGHALWVTLNRPEALNAMSRALVGELRELFGGLGEQRDVRVVVLRGAGATPPTRSTGSRTSAASPRS